ncbi:MAG: methylmalonyl-CoA decarboxylase [Acidimicrobiales bacterium]
METSEILADAQDRVVDEAVAELEQRHSRYKATSTESRRHLQDLFQLVVRCARDGDAEPIVASSHQIAADRFAAGSDIGEVQGEFNVLEEVLWRELADTLSGEQRVEALELLSAALGAGRDALARTYVALAGASRTAGVQPSAHLGAEAPVTAQAVVDGNLVTEVIGKVGVITLGDRRRRNAISAKLATGIVSALESLQAQNCRAVVLRAAEGMSVWSGGRDITELPRGRRDPLAYNDPLEEMLRAIRIFPAPIVAMVHGSVWGGAFDLVLSCDMVVADETASFAITPANLGLPYNTTGLLHFLGRLPINLIKEMFFTAEPVDAHKAKEWLVVNHLVEVAELESFTLQLATKMASKSPLAITVIKEQLRVLNDYQPIAAQVYERIQGLRREAYDSSDYLEGLNAFAEKRQPIFRGT